VPADPDSILGPLLHEYFFSFHRFDKSAPAAPPAPLVYDTLKSDGPATLPFTGSLAEVARRVREGEGPAQEQQQEEEEEERVATPHAATPRAAIAPARTPERAAPGGLPTSSASPSRGSKERQLRGRFTRRHGDRAATLARYAQGAIILGVSVGLYVLLTVQQ